MKLTLLHLYPQHLNIYGDQGNIICLKKRCRLRNINLTIRQFHPGQTLEPNSFDLLFSGGGQDQQQIMVSKDLQKHQKVLIQACQHHIPMLTICGSYQLFGQYFKPFKGPKLKGIGLFKAYTTASQKRKIGNIVIKPSACLKLPVKTPQTIVGFENHSGNTFLESGTKALGKVIKGFGNNQKDQTSGAICYQTIGCYLHGPLLPKNPHLTDWLIQKALKVKYKTKITLKKINDQLEWQAHRQAVNLTKRTSHSLLKYL